MSHTIKEGQGTAWVIKYKGVFDYNALTTFIIKWLKDRHFEVNEKKHKHKYSCPHGFEIERVIEAWRKINDYYMYELSFSFLLLDAFEVDAVKDGKNVKLWNARMIMSANFKVVCDYEGKWDKSEFLEKLHKKVYCEYIIKKEIIVKYTDPMYYKLLSLQKKVKDMLQMETATDF